MSAIAIDWSGAKQPAAKIWMACARDGHLDRLEAIPTRAEAIDQLVDALSHDRNSVAGLDFAFSFPAWFLRSCETLTVFDFWAVVAREGERWLHTCAPPFWGRPGKKKPVGLVHYRRTEELLRKTEQLAPKSCFQIGGAGSVGTGSIRGIPYLSQLREAGIAVWPFDRPRQPLVVEIYPRLLTGSLVKSSEAARADYLAATWITLASKHRDAAVASDDAFDAAISALVMDRHIAEFENLPLGDKVSRLEGEVWTPRFTLDEVFKASPRSLTPEPAHRVREEDRAAMFEVVSALTPCGLEVVPRKGERVGHLLIGEPPVPESKIEVLRTVFKEDAEGLGCTPANRVPSIHGASSVHGH